MALPLLAKPPRHGCGDPGAEIPFACLRDGGQYFARSPAVSGNRRTWTWSVWMRRSKLGTSQMLKMAYSAFAVGGQRAGLSWQPNNTLVFSQGPIQLAGASFVWVSQRVFRDPGAWMHLCVRFDSTAAMATERIVVSIDGEPIVPDPSASSGYQMYPNLGFEGALNSAVQHWDGRYYDTNGPTVYYLPNDEVAEDIFLDGVAVGPEAFGYVNRFGLWVPHRFKGEYGAQGWHRDYADPLDLGKDVSGNGNHWTTSGLTAANQVTDTPTHGYPTYTPLNINSTMALSDGNLTALKTSSSGSARGSHLLPATGKWYWEGTLINGVDNYIGIAKTLPAVGAYIGGAADAYAYRSFSGSGKKVNDSVFTTYGAAAVSGDVVGVCYDADAGTIRYSINGVLYEVAFSGLSGRFFPAVSSQWTNGGTGWALNFGQRLFAYTPPQGYKALSTPNLPCPAIKTPSKYFARRLASGGAGVADLPWSPLAVKTLVLSRRYDTGTAARINASILPGQPLTTVGTTLPVAEDGLTFTATGYTIGTAATYEGSRIDYVWRASRAAGFDLLVVDHVAGTPTTVPHAAGGIVDFAMVFPLAGGKQRGFHRSLAAGQYIVLNADTIATDTGWWSSSAVDLTLGGSLATGQYLVAAWRGVPGFSAFDSWRGNASADGALASMDFAPALVLERSLSTSHGLWMFDSARSPANPVDNRLPLNSTDVPATGYALDFLSNGIKARTSSAYVNGSGATHVFAAWAEIPGKFARAR